MAVVGLDAAFDRCGERRPAIKRRENRAAFFHPESI
jgi:hypothetical protein